MTTMAIADMPSAAIINMFTREVIERGNYLSDEEIARSEVAKLIGGDPDLVKAQNLAANAVKTRRLDPVEAARRAIVQCRRSFNPHQPSPAA